MYLIWSEEHRGYRRQNNRGYTASRAHAGRYSLEEATILCLSSNLGQKNSDPPNETIQPIHTEEV